MTKTTNNSKVVEAKFMWMDKNGKIHYISKEQFNKVVSMLEKGVDTGIKGLMFVGVSTITGGHVFAAEENPVMIGLQPLIDTIGHFAQPVAYGYMLKGMMSMMQAKEEEGKKTLKYAIGGFLGAKFVPQIMNFIDGLNLFV